MLPVKWADANFEIIHRRSIQINLESLNPVAQCVYLYLNVAVLFRKENNEILFNIFQC